MIKKKKPKFIRRNWNKYKRLGLRNKKKQKWQRPRGKHSKMRKRRKGYPARVGPGYRNPVEVRGTVLGLNPVLVKNVNDLIKVGENEIAIIAHVGKKNRNAILKKAEEMKIKMTRSEK